MAASTCQRKGVGTVCWYRWLTEMKSTTQDGHTAHMFPHCTCALFWFSLDRILLCSPVWPQAHNYPSSVS
jgi:hypothetical protein